MAIDGTTLNKVLQERRQPGHQGHRRDRLIKGTKNVDYYATFDNFQVGVLQASSIVDKLGLKQGRGRSTSSSSAARRMTITAYFFYDGAMIAQTPIWTAAARHCATKQLGMNKVGTLRWDGATTRAAWTTCSSAFYGAQKVHAVLCRRMTASPSASCPRSGAWAAARPNSRASRVRARCRDPVGGVHPQGHEQHSTIYKGHAQSWGDGLDGGCVVAGKAPEVNDTKTTTMA